MNLYQLQVACDKLTANLNLNPSLPKSKGYSFYADAYLANYFLSKVANDPGIANYQNVIYGSDNTLSGNKNIIFGANNNVNGNYNYIFSEDFDSSQLNPNSLNNNLVLDEWLIRLLNIPLIPFWPSKSISTWK